MSTYAEATTATARCSHCGQTSPADSEATARSWFRQHRRHECAAAPSRAAIGREDAELAARIAYVRRLENIPVPADPAAAWGSRSGSSFSSGTMGLPGPRNGRIQAAPPRNTRFV